MVANKILLQVYLPMPKIASDVTQKVTTDVAAVHGRQSSFLECANWDAFLLSMMGAILKIKLSAL